MLRDLLAGQGCQGGGNPLGRLVGDQAQAMARNAAMPHFKGAPAGSHLSQMMAAGAPPQEMEAHAMAEAFEREMMAGESPNMFMPHHMMGMHGPHGGAAFDGGWADEFAGPQQFRPPMMMMPHGGGGAWADEMMMQRAAMRGPGAAMGAMGAMIPLGRMGPRMGPMMKGLDRPGMLLPDVMQHRPESAAVRGADGKEAALEEAFSEVSSAEQLMQKMSMREREGGGAWGEQFAAGLGQQWAHELGSRQSDGWAHHAKERGGGGGQGWVDEMAAGRGREGWVDEFQRDKTTGEAWADEFKDSEAWANEFGDEVRELGMSQALEDVLNGDPDLARTRLRDFVAAINKGDITFENGSIIDSTGGLWDPSTAEDAMSARPYVFRDANAYLGRNNCFQTGVDLLANGQVSESISAFEAEVQKNPDNADAWLSLGLAHAENDEDIKAIIALNRAVQVDSENLDAMLALGVSHTNELEQVHALRHLQSWIRRHPDYSSLVSTAEPDTETPTFYLHNQVIQMFQEASRARPDDQELYTVLGVLYNLSYEYPKAVDAFREALRINPNDYAMWNKLGATLANSMRSDEAIDAYIKALEIKPNYVRALANLGIAYSNQEMYNEAASCYLKALSMNPEAVHIWSSLRVVFNCLNRHDLAEQCDLRNVEVFRGQLDF